MTDNRLTIRLSELLMALLENRATSEKRTKSEVVRDILKASLKPSSQTY